MKNLQLLLIAAAAITLGSTSAFAENAIPKSYPLTKCVVSGDKLGGHGKAIKVTYKGTDVWLCCEDCKADFKKNPAKYVKMVQQAASKK